MSLAVRSLLGLNLAPTPLTRFHTSQNTSKLLSTRRKFRVAVASDSDVDYQVSSKGINKYSASVAIIGAGAVGAGIASDLIKDRSVSQVLMVDRDSEKVAGEVLDLDDAAGLFGCTVRVSNPQEAGQASIVIITAGAKQKPGESRSDLLGRNAGIITTIVESMMPFGEDTVLLLVSNPVDVLTAVAQKVSGLAHHRVIGSGTFLDSMRLRGIVGHKLGVAASNVHVNVVGEHGDAQFPVWSAASVGGCPMNSVVEMTAAGRAEMARTATAKAYEIIQRKGCTFFGIAACTTIITRSIIMNTSNVMPLTCWNEKREMYISQPCVVGSRGVKEVMAMGLNEEEAKMFEKAAASIQANVDSCI